MKILWLASGRSGDDSFAFGMIIVTVLSPLILISLSDFDLNSVSRDDSFAFSMIIVGWLVGWLVACLLACLLACLTSQQQASVSQGRICSDNLTCCHTEIEVADQTFYLTQSQYTDTGPTSPSADPIASGAWQGSHWSASF